MQHFGLRLVATLLGFAGSTGIAHAQWDTTGTMQSRISSGLYGLGKWSGFIPPEGPPRNFVQILGAYTNGLLTLLGLLFLIMIIRGGVIWMTAGGEEEKARQAKLIIKNSVYGLAIVLLARIFTGFYLGFLAPAVTTP